MLYFRYGLQLYKSILPHPLACVCFLIHLPSIAARIAGFCISSLAAKPFNRGRFYLSDLE